jgi:small subunit ribosomal protein S16
VVVADGRSPRDGRYIEIIGQYAPREEPSHVSIDDEKALAWLRKGAQPTEQVQRLLLDIGVWERYQTERGRTVDAPARAARTSPKPSKKAQARAQTAQSASAESEATDPAAGNAATGDSPAEPPTEGAAGGDAEVPAE